MHVKPQVLHANDQLRIQMRKGKVFQVSALAELGAM